MVGGYTKGLHEIGDGLWAYLQPDGGWGWSNAGLVAGDRDGESLLIDTLFDLRLTAEMLDAMRRVTPAASRIGTVVNTHANGDHWFGNALVADADIIASRACAEEMAELPPSSLATLLKAAPDLGEAGRFLLKIFEPFEFDGIEAVPAKRTFEGELELSVAGKVVRLIEVGPAHTRGDVVAHVPEDGVVFTGDILFHGGHPIVWAGPVTNWIAACDRILTLDRVSVVVPGHGPVTNRSAVADLKGYFEYMTAQARMRFDAGMNPVDAAADIDLGPYLEWGERERVVVNVCALYRDFGAQVPSDAATLFGHMAQFG
jgi:glyoxylase-like metal-dependent hydrolase (beta-lactamase superfamily II)